MRTRKRTYSTLIPSRPARQLRAVSFQRRCRVIFRVQRKLERHKLTPFFRCFRPSAPPLARSFGGPNCLKGDPQVRFCVAFAEMAAKQKEGGRAS